MFYRYEHYMSISHMAIFVYLALIVNMVENSAQALVEIHRGKEICIFIK